MRGLLPGLLVAALCAAPAAAQVAGHWQVNGKIDDRAFVLDCQFTPAGGGFGGVCVETAKNKRHVLTKGSVVGAKIGWSYEASFMMMSFDVNFAGTMAGNSITGTATAHGHSGPFTAIRE